MKSNSSVERDCASACSVARGFSRKTSVGGAAVSANSMLARRGALGDITQRHERKELVKVMVLELGESDEFGMGVFPSFGEGH